MGIKIFGSSSSYDNCKSNKNPDPSNYGIIRNIDLNDYLIVEIKYLDCTNYEGNKILVFDKGIRLYNLLTQKSIDPHFSENEDFISPIARFVPTEEGWIMAQVFAKFYPE